MVDEKISFKTIKDNSYQVFDATDAFGGITPNGKMVTHFFTDMVHFPDEFNLNVDKDGFAKEKSIPNNKQVIDRVLKGTLVLNPQDALKICGWMLSNLMKAESDVNKDFIKEQISNILEGK